MQTFGFMFLRKPRIRAGLWRCAVLTAASLAIAGCSGPRVFGGSPNVSIMPGSVALPAPSAEDIAFQPRLYAIGPFDMLDISVFGSDEFDLEIQADAGGNIAVPLLGNIQAAGMTPSELARFIETGLRGRYFRDPQVSVNLKETQSQVVTVDGSVRRPGIFPVTGRMTLIQAIARAEGTTEFARVEDVVIFRTVGQQKLAGIYNLGAIRLGRYDDPEVFANDVVVVGDSPRRRFLKDVLTLGPALLSPVILLLTQTSNN
ncbi:polysaccharide biosynthesis/export family protein [Blastomonas sp.]|uniref:polysaccharide biosynthesis/export family protein n=1 Tax=Blastomonas sp. TaxID=1909299 RepID=UPI00260D4312|nr:polysaccharide biosynthesis/export family protein [Blastomonas sp.]MDM7957519.1 polysaccharide biosynthesis/export family protein [Blastomonas sp.]